MNKSFIDRTGQQYGKLIVIDRASNNKWSQARWNCKCECGRLTIVDAANLSTGHTISCGRCILVSNLVGKVFGKLTVMHLVNSERKGPIWACVCSCSPEIIIQVTGYNLRNGQKSCGCSRRGENNPMWSGRLGSIEVTYWKRLLVGASERNIEVSIDHQYIADLYDKQQGRCALSNVELIPPKINKTGWTASLDRIDNKKGYVEGNLQWIHKDINIMKRHHDQEHFINMCAAVAEFSATPYVGGLPS